MAGRYQNCMGVLNNKYLSALRVRIESALACGAVTIQCWGKHSYPQKNRQHSTDIKVSFKNVSYFAFWTKIIPSSQNKTNKSFPSLESFKAEYLCPSTEDYVHFRHFLKWQAVWYGQILRWFMRQTEIFKKVVCISLLSLYNIDKESFRSNVGNDNNIWVLYNDFLGS